MTPNNRLEAETYKSYENKDVELFSVFSENRRKEAVKSLPCWIKDFVEVA